MRLEVVECLLCFAEFCLRPREIFLVRRKWRNCRSAPRYHSIVLGVCVQGRALLNAVGNLEMRGPYGDALKELGYTLEARLFSFGGLAYVHDRLFIANPFISGSFLQQGPDFCVVLSLPASCLEVEGTS
jgi:hypothetical protein